MTPGPAPQPPQGPPAQQTQPQYAPAQAMPAPAAGAPFFGAPGSYIPPRKRLVLACLGGANILAMLLAFSLPVYTLSSFFGISKTVTLFTSGFCVVFFLVSLVLIVCAVGLMFLGTKVRRGALFIYPVVGTLFGGLLLVLSVHWSAVDADPGLGVAVERGPGFLFLWVTVITYIAMAVLGFLFIRRPAALRTAPPPMGDPPLPPPASRSPLRLSSRARSLRGRRAPPPTSRRRRFQAPSRRMVPADCAELTVRERRRACARRRTLDSERCED